MIGDRLAVRLLNPLGVDRDAHVAQAVSDLVPTLVCHLRSADGGGEWHFRRVPAPDPATLELRFRSRTAVLAELEKRLHLRCADLGWTVLPAEPPAAGPAEPSLASDLSGLSSDLALDLLATGGLAAADPAGLAALHLRMLIELVPPADRRAFLFLYWQHWGLGLAPAARVELGRRAEPLARDVLEATAGLALEPPWRGLWARYLHALHATWRIRAAGDPPPRAYELFEHAHLTHGRLGIPVEAEAVAAKALRSALSAGPEVPDMTSVLLTGDLAMAAA